MADFEKMQTEVLPDKILEQELAGVVRYTHSSDAHSSCAVFGHGRVPVVPLLDSYRHDADGILHETRDAEISALELYRSLLDVAAGKSAMPEE